jgi:hypothetical protein
MGVKESAKKDTNDLVRRRRTDSTCPEYIASMSSHIGAVNGWCVLLHRPCAKKSLSLSERVNSGNSVTHRKCGLLGGV